MRLCQSKLLDVISVQPEVMHHYEPPHDAGYWSEVDTVDGKGVASYESEFETKMGGTEDILNSARCKALFDSTCVKQYHEEC